MDDALGSVAAGFMMANAINRLTWKRALFTFTILQSGKLELGGQWIDFLRKRFHDGEEIGIKLVDRLLGGTTASDLKRMERIKKLYQTDYPSGVSIPPKGFRKEHGKQSEQ